MARVEAVLRRCTGYDGRPETYRFGEVHVDFKKMETRKGHKKLAMSHREFDLLRFMIEHRGEVLPRERILSAVWGYENGSFTRTVDMHVAKLRKKLEHRRDILIHTVVRQGYVLQLNGSSSRTQLEASAAPIREPGASGEAYPATV